MFRRFQTTISFYCGVGAIALFSIVIAGCQSPEHYKADADKEVYDLIDTKWKSGFGGKSNYKISDATPSPNDILIDDVPYVGSMNLAQAVAIATAQNRDYQDQKEELYLSALDLTLERHKYARQWFSVIDATFTKDQGDEDTTVEAVGGFDYTRLLANGAIISYGLAIDWVRFLTGDPRTSLGTVLNASLAVPLLGNGAGKIAREELTQAERQVLYDIRTFNRFRKNFVVSIMSRYYIILQQKDEVTNAENDHERRLETRERLEMEAKAGRRNRFEVDQAEQDVLKAKDSFVQTQRDYEQSLDEFKITLALSMDTNLVLDQNELKALEEIGLSKINYALDSAIETALLRRLDLANSADAIDDAVRIALLAAEGLAPQINLTGSADVRSKEKTDFTNLQFHDGRYDFGLEVDLPFDRLPQRNNYRAATIALIRSQRAYEDAVDNVKLEVISAYRKLRESADRYKIQKNSLDLAEKRVESTKLLLEAGRSTTRDSLEAQDALLDAQNDLTDVLVQHAIAKLRFFRDIGILEVRPDGMWEQ